MTHSEWCIPQLILSIPIDLTATTDVLRHFNVNTQIMYFPHSIAGLSIIKLVLDNASEQPRLHFPFLYLWIFAQHFSHLATTKCLCIFPTEYYKPSSFAPVLCIYYSISFLFSIFWWQHLFHPSPGRMLLLFLSMALKETLLCIHKTDLLTSDCSKLHSCSRLCVLRHWVIS